MTVTGWRFVLQLVAGFGFLSGSCDGENRVIQ